MKCRARWSSLVLATIGWWSAAATASAAAESPGIVEREFLYETAPFPSCHASTIVETARGTLLAAFFGGTREGAKDVSVHLCRRVDGVWSAPVEAANGMQPDGERHPCWNPVLYQVPEGPLWLFYKVGPNPRTWWGMRLTSHDDGQTWSQPERLPDGILGPIKNKPVRLADGTIVCPTSIEDAPESPAWRLQFESSRDGGKSWRRSPTPQASFGAIQPSILLHADGTLQAIGRTQAKSIFTATSSDRGATWSALELLPLPNPNSGTDALTLADGRHLLVYNHTSKGRSPLNVAISADGKAWQAAAVLEDQPGEFSYPACVQSRDGRVHVTYTWRRQKIVHLTLDPAQLVLRPIENGVWPASEAR